MRHVGAVFLAEEAATGEILGFADVGLTIFDPRRRTFRLPKRPEGVGTDSVQAHLKCRPYLSNLAVDERQRRRGVGRLLVDACEAEVRTWQGALDADGDDEAQASPADEGTAASAANGPDGSSVQTESIWLEVSLDNEPARLFYERMGYDSECETAGREIVRKRWSFDSEVKRRCMMRKRLDNE